MVTKGPDNEPGINGGLLFRKGSSPEEGQAVNAYVCTIEVDMIDAYLNKALKAGVSIALLKMPVKGVGWLIYCKDTEGNIFGMLQSDEKAE